MGSLRVSIWDSRKIHSFVTKIQTEHLVHFWHCCPHPHRMKWFWWLALSLQWVRQTRRKHTHNLTNTCEKKTRQRKRDAGWSRRKVSLRRRQVSRGQTQEAPDEAPGRLSPELAGQRAAGVAAEGETNVTGRTVLLAELEHSRGGRTGHGSAPDTLPAHQAPRTSAAITTPTRRLKGSENNKAGPFIFF